MAWCNNCNKDGLRKADVEFCYDTKKILCHGCYALAHPSWMPPSEIVDMSAEPEPVPQLDYSLSFDSKGGFTAQVSYGELALKFNAPMDHLKKYLGAA